MAGTKDFTHREAREAFYDFLAEVGSSAHLHVTINNVTGWGSDTNLSATVYPKGLTGVGSREQFDARADTYRELLAALREAWASRADAYAATTLRAMALKIIEITADIGECTDAALRADFDAKDVERFAAIAADTANTLAAGGPFEVIVTSGANSNAEAA
jgi:hypothetical protein